MVAMAAKRAKLARVKPEIPEQHAPGDMEDDDQATARVLDFLSTCRQAHENMQAIEKEVGMLEEEAGMLEEAPEAAQQQAAATAAAKSSSATAQRAQGRLRQQGQLLQVKKEVKAEAAAEGGRSAKSATKLVARIKKEMAAEPAKASTSSASTSAKEEPRGELVDKKNMHQLGSEAAQQLWYQAALEEARPEKEETEEERWEEEETDSAVEHRVWLEPKGVPRPGEGPSHDENSR